MSSTNTTIISNGLALITGGTRGLGFEVVRQLASDETLKGFNGITIKTCLVGCRSVQSATQQLKALEAENKNGVRLIPIELDVSKDESVQKAADHVAKTYGNVDILISNAGVLRWANSITDNDTINVNLLGSVRLYKAFKPLLNKTARVVYVGSGLGAYHSYYLKANHSKELNEISTLTEQRIIQYGDNYLKAREKGSSAVIEEFGGDSQGFAYTFSKVLLHALLRVHAFHDSNKDVIYSAVDPGYCATELNGNSGPRPASMGGRAIILAAFLHANATSGLLWADGEKQEFIQKPEQQYLHLMPKAQ